ERDTLLGHVLHGLLDALHDDLGGVDDLAAAIDAAEPDAKTLREIGEAAYVAGGRNRELHHQLVDPQTAQRIHDGVVGAFRRPSLASLVAPAEVHGGRNTRDPIDDAVNEVDATLGFAVGVGEARSHLGVHEEAKVGVVQLHRVHARLGKSDDLLAKD